jgi:sucrose-6-phosphate hydrolase SacC (GH32 family)
LPSCSARPPAAGGTSEESKGQPFTQCIAYSTDRGRTFTKYEKNPVLPHLIGGNRDPKVVWHAPTRRWIMALYKDGDTYAFFASPDLKAWTHLEDLKVPGCGECPDFFEMPVDGDRSKTRWVFTAASGRYLVGTFDGKTFTPDGKDALPADWGANYYAVQTWSDVPPEDGRRIQIAWMNGGRYPKMPFNQQMSFPCQMRLRTFPEGLRICRTPVREIETLHDKESQWEALALGEGPNPLKDCAGDLFDIRAEIEPADAAEITLTVRGEPIRWSAKDRKVSCLGREGPLEPADGRIKLQVLVDRSSLEVFGNDGKLAMTSCFLPRPSRKGLALAATGGAARIVSLKVWTLKSAWGPAK